MKSLMTLPGLCFFFSLALCQYSEGSDFSCLDYSPGFFQGSVSNFPIKERILGFTEISPAQDFSYIATDKTGLPEQEPFLMTNIEPQESWRFVFGAER